MDDSFLKIAETGKGKDRFRIARLVQKGLSSKDDIALSEEIKGVFGALKISGRKVRLNIPRHLVTVRFLRLPSTDDEEIGKIIKIESLKYVPYADEEVVAGHKVIEKQEDGYSVCLLAIAQAKAVERLINILNPAQGGEVELVSLGSEALLEWYLAAEPSPKGNCLIAGIDRAHVDIDVAEDEKLVFTRGVAYDPEGRSAIEEIAEQIRVSLVTYQKESDKKINRVLLTGSGPKTASCRQALAEMFNVPVEVIDQMKGASFAQSADCDIEDASFAELLGIAAKDPSDIRISLMPENISRTARAASLKRNIAAGAILTALLIALVFGLVMKRLYDKKILLSYFDSQLKEIAPQVAKVRKMMDNIKVVGEEMNKNMLAVDVVREVYKLTPQAISLGMLDYEKGASLTIRGAAPALNEVLGYVNTLEGSLFFESVKVRYATKRVVASKESVDFEITCGISRPK